MAVAGGRGAARSLLRLDPGATRCCRFLTRVQGLILPRGNPRRVRSLADVAAKAPAIVNRQPGSGTRILLDRLLAHAAASSRRTSSGYTNEEFTHAAVAATIAAGKADAGFGIEAAAAQFGLAFVPVVSERYLFACRRRTSTLPRFAAFRALIADEATRDAVRHLAGYALDDPGAERGFGRRATARSRPA